MNTPPPYNFSDKLVLSTDVEFCEKILDGEITLLIEAFKWLETPQGLKWNIYYQEVETIPPEDIKYIEELVEYAKIFKPFLLDVTREN